MQETRSATIGKGRAPTSGLSGDMAGGFSAALIAIPQAMSLGLLAFAALGPAYASAGVVAGLLASAVGNLTAAAVPAARCQILAARASTTVVFAALVAALAAHPQLQTPAGPDASRILTLAFLALFLSGIVQLVLGYTGFGRAIKFVPYPVVAGFMNGIALTILLSQIGPAIGLHANARVSALFAEGIDVRPGSIAVTVIVIAAVALVPRWTRRVSGLFAGLVIGITLHHALGAVFPGSVGPVVGPLPEVAAVPREMARMVDLARSGEAGLWLSVLLPHALLLAAIASLDGLLASVIGDAVTHGRHDSSRVLKGQGAANCLGAAFGAIPAVSSAHTRIAAWLAGGRTPMATMWHAVFVLAVLVALGPVVAHVPVAALAGLMIAIGWTLVDQWTRDVARALIAGEGGRRGEAAANLGVVVAVAVSLLVFDMMTAFAIGVVAAVGLVLVKLSGSPVGRRLDGTVRASLKIRSPEARAALRPLAGGIRILELQGELFFGTADALQTEVDGLPEGTRILILDFRRVNQIDATGGRVLTVIGQRAARRGMEVLLADVREDDPHGRFLRALGVSGAIDPSRWFPDLDRALEWAEDRLLQRARFEDAPELAPRDMPLFADFDDEDMAAVTAALERHELGHGDVVFSEGDDGDRMYLIARGAVSIKVRIEGDQYARRLATFTPGVFFGEMSLLEGNRRSADAFAKGEHVVLYSLSAQAFERIVQGNPRLGLRIHQALARELVARLRTTTGALRALE